MSLMHLTMDDAASLRLEEFRDGDQLVVRADMPGIDPDRDVEISVTDHTLRIKGERTESSEQKDKAGYRSEVRYGAFVRDVALPAGVDAADVTATYRDGVLEVRVPVSNELSGAVKVPVTRG